ncbi:MAG: FAD-binding oxidoreductase [Candidatus Helarchaeota archaeon]
MNKDKLLELLTSIFGKDSVSTDPALLYVYSMDVSIKEHLPDAVVMPQDRDQVVQVVKMANTYNIPLIPRGAGTGASGGAVAVKGGIILDFTRMNKILHVDLANLQVVVEPGAVHADLNKALEQFGFYFPVIPGSSDMCTIGGMVGNGASGLRAVKYGTTKDYILDLEVILSDGTVATLGSTVQKSASGYDLLRLFVGSEGTLGIITKISLKILPIPETRGVVSAFFDNVKQAGKCVLNIFRARIVPAAIELLDKSAIEAINLYKPSMNLPAAEALLLVELDGTKEGVVATTEKVHTILKDNGAFETKMTTDDEERLKLWNARKIVGAAARRVRDGYARIYEGEDITVPLSEIANTLLKLRELSSEFDLPIVVFGHIGDGNLHPAILIQKENSDHWKKLNQLSAKIHEYTIEIGGTVTGEHGIGLTRAKYLQRERPTVLRLMRKIKKALDPNNIMNPGKMDLDGGYSLND